jgi:hypothetical protein
LGAARYDLCVSEAAVTDPAACTAAGPRGVTSPWRVAGLVNGKTYRFVVAAAAPSGRKAYSAEALATPAGIPEGSPLAVGDGYLVAVSGGNLAGGPAFTEPERVTALADYLSAHADRFGAPGVSGAALSFEAVSPAGSALALAGEEFAVVALYQTHQGAPVIDAVQYGVFRRDRVGGDQLRRVFGRLRDPGTLPAPPATDRTTLAQVQAAAEALIAERGLDPDAAAYTQTPVISAGHGRAGFLVTGIRQSGKGSLGTFQALVSVAPGGAPVTVLEHRPPCDAATPLPPGAGAIVAPPPLGFHPSAPLTGLRFVRLQAVVLADDDGSNPAPVTGAQIQTWVDEANTVWTPQARLHFLFDPAKDILAAHCTALNTQPATKAAASTYTLLGNVVPTLFLPDRLVVYFRARGGGGFSWGPATTRFVSMPSYTNTGILKPSDEPGGDGVIGNDTLLSHELGHKFGLAHTFGSDVACGSATPANSDEDRKGQDEASAADDVTDTNPDLRDDCSGGFSPSLACPGGVVTFNGHTWDQPWTNVMSYHDCLPEELTPEQLAVIELTLGHPSLSVLLK